ncbi:MAG: DUF5666 domain-containing protein [Candidatus Doudnabacteria bacterium]|jgi:hypothetical protein
MNKKHIGIVAVIVIVAAGGGFFGGMKYAQSKSSIKPGSFAAGQGRTGMFQQGNGGSNVARRTNSGGQFVNGQVLSKDEKSVTVKVGDTGSKIIFYSSSTSIGKTTSGTAEDIAVGSEVMVSGTSNSDGSITAQNIQIRPNTPQTMGQPVK